MGLKEVFPRLKLPKKGMKIEVLPTLNAVLITLLFLYFYNGDLQYVLSPIAVAGVFGGKIRDGIVHLFVNRITQGAHLLMFLALTALCVQIFINSRVYRPTVANNT